MELGYFTAQEWTFINMNFIKLLGTIPPQDKEAFDFAFDDIEPTEYLHDAIVGGLKYLLNTDTAVLPAAVTRLKRYLATFSTYELIILVSHILPRTIQTWPYFR